MKTKKATACGQTAQATRRCHRQPMEDDVEAGGQIVNS